MQACSYKTKIDSNYYCQKLKLSCTQSNKIVYFKTTKGDFEVKLDFDEIKSVKLDISEGFNPRRRIALVLKGRKKPLPLSGAGELKPLLQVEEEGARLAKFLEVNLEGLK